MKVIETIQKDNDSFVAVLEGSAEVARTERSEKQVEAAGTVAAGAGTVAQGAGEGVIERNTENKMRGVAGKFMPGHPATPGAGRKRRDLPDVREYFRENYTLEELFGRLNAAYDVAARLNSSKGMIAATELILAYGLGKPVQQVVHEAKRSELLELLAADDTPLLPDKEIEQQC